MPQDFQPGEKVGAGRYVLEKELGRGGMGVVWLASDSELGEQVALKFVPAAIQHDPMALDDMRRETLKSRRLTHPNIARIHDFCNFEAEAPFITMEFMDGPNLSALQVEQPDRVFSWEKIQPWIKQLCSALQYAHEENVIHRDLKPGNLMIDSKRRIKLCDFGLAASAADSMSRISRDMGSSGTPPYMSPQQLDGGAPSPSDDIDSLGATIYELLTGKPPFHSGDIPHQIRSNAPSAIPNKLAELGVANPVPEAAAALVMQCLVKNPVHRPASAEAVAEAAAGVSAGPPPLPVEPVPEESAASEVHVEDADGNEDVAVPEATELSDPEPSEPPEELQKRKRRNKILLWAFIGFVLLSALKKAGNKNAGQRPGADVNTTSSTNAEWRSGEIVSLTEGIDLKQCDMIVLRQSRDGDVQTEVEWRKATSDNGIWSINGDGVIQGRIEGAPDATRKSYLILTTEGRADFELAFAFDLHNRPGGARLNSGVFYRLGGRDGWFMHGVSPFLEFNGGRVDPDVFARPARIVFDSGTEPLDRSDAFWSDADSGFARRIEDTELFGSPAPQEFFDAGHWWLIKVRGDQLRHFLDGAVVSDARIDGNGENLSGGIAIEIWAAPGEANTVEYEGFFLRTLEAID